VKFGWEPVDTLIAEPNAADLLREHYEALGVHKEKLKLDVAWGALSAAEAEGRFRVWTARDDGLLAGYLGLWIIRHGHFQETLMAVEDSFLLSAPYRKGWTGIRMLKEVIAALREMGVGLLIIHEKVHFVAARGGLGKLYRRLGFYHSDNLWSKVLE
jgi:GNAT superfamily N-acetyltransferase